MSTEEHMVFTTREAVCLQQISELDRYTDGAAVAISKNDLGLLEENLWRQRLVAVALESSLRDLIKTDGPLHLACIQAQARKSLARNRNYLILLQQAALHAAMLQRLCQAHNEQRSENAVLEQKPMRGTYV